jgi:hypothetical protein
MTVAIQEKTVRVDMAKNDNDPVRQADIERRLANMANAHRCGARTRAGTPCRQAAVKRPGSLSHARWGQGVGRTARCAEWQFQARALDHREQAHTQRNRRTSSA